MSSFFRLSSPLTHHVWRIMNKDHVELIQCLSIGERRKKDVEHVILFLMFSEMSPNVCGGGSSHPCFSRLNNYCRTRAEVRRGKIMKTEKFIMKISNISHFRHINKFHTRVWSTRNWNQIKLFHFREFSMTRAVGMLLLKALYMITSMAFQSEFSAHNVAQIFGLEYVVPAACERWAFHLLKLSFVKVLYCKLEHQSTTTFLIVSAKIFPRSVGPMKGFIWFLIMGWVNMH